MQRIARFFTAPMDAIRPNISSADLRKKILSSESSIIEHDFGLAQGSVYFVRPDDMSLIDELLQQIHQQPNERKTQSHTAWIVGGKNMLAMPYQQAMPHHKLHVQRFSHSRDYIGYTIKALEQFITTDKKIRLTTFIAEPIFNLLSMGLFELDQLPADLMKAFNKFSSLLYGEEEGELIEDDRPVASRLNSLGALAATTHKLLQATYQTKVLDYLSDFQPFRDARDAYLKAARNFIVSQQDIIKRDIRTYAEGQPIRNLLSLSVIEVIRQRDEHLCEDRESLNTYLKQLVDDPNPSSLNALLADSYIESVPGNLFAAENIKQLISCLLYNLTIKPTWLTALRDAFTQYNLNSDLSNMHEVIEADKKQNGILHRIYIEGMRLRNINPKAECTQFGDQFHYYITNPINIRGMLIQGGSVISILNGMRLVTPVFGKDPELFNPDRYITEVAADAVREIEKIPLSAFSYLPRRCPAYNIAEYIAKTFVSYLAMNYDLTLHAKPSEGNASKIQLACSTREVEKPRTISLSM